MAIKKIKEEIKPALCENCRVLDFGMCPNLLCLYDNGFCDPPVKRCAWKDFFDNIYQDVKDGAEHSAKWGKRKKAD